MLLELMVLQHLKNSCYKRKLLIFRNQCFLQHQFKSCCKAKACCINPMVSTTFLGSNISENNIAENIGITTFVKSMLLKQLVLQHLQKQCCWNHWFYNLSKNDAAKTNGFTTFTKTTLPEPLVLQHFHEQCCQNHWFYNMSKTNVARTISVTACPKIMCPKRLVLQHVQKRCC